MLAIRVVNLGGREEGVHTKGAGLIWDDRNDSFSGAWAAKQVLEQTNEGHGGGNLLVSGTGFGDCVGLVFWKLERDILAAALWQVTAKFATALVHVLNLRRIASWVEVRRLVRVFFKLDIANRNAKLITEALEVLQCQLLHLVSCIATLKRLTKGVALDGLGQDNGWLPLVLHGCLVSRVNLAVVMATAL